MSLHSYCTKWTGWKYCEALMKLRVYLNFFLELPIVATLLVACRVPGWLDVLNCRKKDYFEKHAHLFNSTSVSHRNNDVQ